MTLRVLASLFILCVIIYIQNLRMRKYSEKKEKDFWSKEEEANSVRRKSLDSLDYIHIPIDKLPIDTCKEDEEIAQCVRGIIGLCDVKIVNLTGFTNTELKLQYGAPNITELTNFDSAYTVLASTLQKWAHLLNEKGYVSEAKTIYEFAVETKTDVRQTYFDLAKIYHDNGNNEKIDSLIETSESLNSLNGSIISRTLKEQYK